MSETLKPMITTIIPTYRRPELLRRAIRSVLSQTYPHLQVCVYDNASGDDTASVVAEMAKADPRVKYHCHSENIGAGKNFIYGAEHVETPFFSFLSDDDILLPEFYETALMSFEEHPESIFSATATVCINTLTKVSCIPLLAWPPGFYQPPEGLLAMLKYSHPVWTGVLYRKEVISEIGTDLIGSSDMSFGLLTAAHFPFTISLKPGAMFVTHASSSILSTHFQMPWLPLWMKLVKTLNDDREIPTEVRSYAKDVLDRRIQRKLFVTGMQAIIEGYFDTVDDILKTFQKYYPRNHKAYLISLTKQTCKMFPPLRFVLAFLRKVRRALRHRESRQMHREFEHFSQYLQMCPAKVYKRM